MSAAFMLPSIMELADFLLKKFQPALRTESTRAGWQPQDLRGVCYVAAADALNGFDPARGDLIARGHAKIEEQARHAGFAPRGAARVDTAVILDAAENFDDPAAVLAAGQLAALLIERGLVAAALGDDVGSERTRRRRVVERRSAAENLARHFGEGKT